MLKSRKLACCIRLICSGLLSYYSAEAWAFDQAYLEVTVNDKALSRNLDVRIENKQWFLQRKDITAFYPNDSLPNETWIAFDALPNTSWQFFPATQRIHLTITPTKTPEQRRQEKLIALANAGYITNAAAEENLSAAQVMKAEATPERVAAKEALPQNIPLPPSNSQLLSPEDNRIADAESSKHLEAIPAGATDASFFLDLSVNYQPREVVLEVKQVNNRWYLRKSELDALNLAWMLPNQEWIALDKLPDTRWEYHETTQRLHLLTAAKYLPLQDLTNKDQIHPLATRATGAFLNYSLFYSDSESAGESSSVLLEANVFTPQLQLTSLGMYRIKDPLDNTQAFTRFDTTLTYEMEKARAVVQLGDVFNSGRSFIPSYRVGGIRIARDFALAPDKIYFPLPEFQGEAELPSTLDIWLNNQQRAAIGLESGPYKLNLDSVSSGFNSATIVTTDIQGRPVTQTLSFYVATDLLKKGLIDYDLTVGRVRNNYGFINDDYGDDTLTSVRAAYGLTKFFTPEFSVQHIDDKYHTTGAIRLGLGHLGSLNTSLTHASTDDTGDGAQSISLGYDFSRYGFGIHANHLERDENFTDLVYSSISNQLRRQSTAGVSYGFRKAGQFSLIYTRREYGERTDIPRPVMPVIDPLSPTPIAYPPRAYFPDNLEMLQFSWNKALKDYGMLSARWQRFEPFQSDAFSLGFTYYFRRGYTAGLQVQNSNERTATNVNIARHTGYPYGVGWNLSASDDRNNPRYGDLLYRHQYGNGAIRVSSNEMDRVYTADWEGSIAYLEKAIYFGSPIYDSFAVIDTGFANIPVYSGFQQYGPAGKNGRRLLPDVTSYTTHLARIDPQDMPENILLADTINTFRVKRAGGVFVDFGLKLATQVRTTLVDIHNQPLPAGATLTNGADQQAWVGWDGDLFIESARSFEQWTWPDGNCSIALPELRLGETNYLDSLVCTPANPQDGTLRHAQ